MGGFGYHRYYRIHSFISKMCSITFVYRRNEPKKTTNVWQWQHQHRSRRRWPRLHVQSGRWWGTKGAKFVLSLINHEKFMKSYNWWKMKNWIKRNCVKHSQSINLIHNVMYNVNYSILVHQLLLIGHFFSTKRSILVRE